MNRSFFCCNLSFFSSCSENINVSSDETSASNVTGIKVLDDDSLMLIFSKVESTRDLLECRRLNKRFCCVAEDYLDTETVKYQASIDVDRFFEGLPQQLRLNAFTATRFQQALRPWLYSSFMTLNDPRSRVLARFDQSHNHNESGGANRISRDIFYLVSETLNRAPSLTLHKIGRLQHQHPLSDCRSFHPSGRMLVTVPGYLSPKRDPEDFTTAKLWLIDHGDKLRPIGEVCHGDELTFVSFSQDGRMLLTASEDGKAMVSILDEGLSVVQSIPVSHEGKVNSACFFDDGMLLTASNDKTVRIASISRQGSRYNLVEAQIIPHAKAVKVAKPSPDGQWIITVTADCKVFLTNLRRGNTTSGDGLINEELSECRTYTHGGFRAIEFSSDSSMALIRYHNKGFLVTFAQGSLPTRHKLIADIGEMSDRQIHCLRFSPDNKSIIISHGFETLAIDMNWAHELQEPITFLSQYRRTNELTRNINWSLGHAIQGCSLSADGRVFLMGIKNFIKIVRLKNEGITTDEMCLDNQNDFWPAPQISPDMRLVTTSDFRGVSLYKMVADDQSGFPHSRNPSLPRNRDIQRRAG